MAKNKIWLNSQLYQFGIPFLFGFFFDSMHNNEIPNSSRYLIFVCFCMVFVGIFVWKVITYWLHPRTAISSQKVSKAKTFTENFSTSGSTFTEVEIALNEVQYDRYSYSRQGQYAQWIEERSSVYSDFSRWSLENIILEVAFIQSVARFYT